MKVFAGIIAVAAVVAIVKAFDLAPDFGTQAQDGYDYTICPSYDVENHLIEAQLPDTLNIRPRHIYQRFNEAGVWYVEIHNDTTEVIIPVTYDFIQILSEGYPFNFCKFLRLTMNEDGFWGYAGYK